MRQPARNESAAKNRWREHLQRSVSCVSPTAILRVGPSPIAERHFSLFPTELPIPVRRRRGGSLFLKLEQLGELIPDERFGGEYRISTRAYYYAIMDTPESELAAWHWRYGEEPHMHHPDPTGEGRRLHYPTGGTRVTVESVIRFMITEWDVEPARADWDLTLADTQGRFDRWQVQDGERLILTKAN